MDSASDIYDLTERLTETRVPALGTAEIERYRFALDRMKQGICVFDGEQRLLLFNRRYAEMYGLKLADLRLGMTLREVIELRYRAGTGPAMAPEEYAAWRDRVQTDDRASRTAVELRSGRVHEIQHEPTPGGGWVASFEDITDKVRSEQRIQHMAHHDGLTGLPNRILLADHLRALSLGTPDPPHTLAILCLDLDRFKEVNDTLGHPAGDQVLRATVQRIRNLLSDDHIFARLGGDEFAIILPNVTTSAAVEALAAAILQAVSMPIGLEKQDVTIGVSIGIAIGERGKANPTVLLRRADIALYRSKAAGRNAYRLFEPDMETRIRQRKRLEVDLGKAVEGRQLEVFLQPQFDVLTRRMCGSEALLRWRHPKQGMVLPGSFIPLAEETGLIVPLGEWILHAACTAATHWKDDRLAVNLSTVQVRHPLLVNQVAAALAASGLPPERLELEITESLLLHDARAALTTLNQLRDLGVSIVLDDFGTGYSSLAYLRRFPFSKLKIDRSFISAMTTDQKTAAIVQAIVTLGHTLGMRVNAEGVETDEQWSLLTELGCDEAQGYLLGRPMPASQFLLRTAASLS